MKDQDRPTWDEMQRDAAPDELEQAQDEIVYWKQQITALREALGITEPALTRLIARTENPPNEALDALRAIRNVMPHLRGNLPQALAATEPEDNDKPALSIARDIAAEKLGHVKEAAATEPEAKLIETARQSVEVAREIKEAMRVDPEDMHRPIGPIHSTKRKADDQG